MFPAYEWDPLGNTAWCQYSYGLSPQYSWVFDYFGGINPEKDFANLSNVIFSNGELDPWHSGGVTFELNDQCKTIMIADSSHHCDLREPNEADPASLKEARLIEREWIAAFVD
jgi:lysosomal Pro-X carboxypeptidase